MSLTGVSNFKTRFNRDGIFSFGIDGFAACPRLRTSLCPLCNVGFVPVYKNVVYKQYFTLTLL